MKSVSVIQQLSVKVTGLKAEATRVTSMTHEKVLRAPSASDISAGYSETTHKEGGAEHEVQSLTHEGNYVIHTIILSALGTTQAI